MTTQRAEAAITIIARERAAQAIRRVETLLGHLGLTFGRLLGIIGRLTLGFTLFQAAIGAIGVALSAAVTVQTIGTMLQFERAAQRARFQLQLFGLSADEAKDMVAALAKVTDRATATALLRSGEAMTAARLAGEQLTVRLASLTQEIAKVTQLDPAQVFTALFKAIVEHDPRHFLDLVGGFSEFQDAARALARQDMPAFRQALEDALDTAERTSPEIERLSENLAALGVLTRGAREQVSGFVVDFLNVFVGTLREKLDTAREHFRIVVAGALAGVMLTSGRFLAIRFAAGFAGALLAYLTVDMDKVIRQMKDNPKLVATIASVATTVGLLMGKRTAAAFLLGAITLFPGLADTFRDVSTTDIVRVAAAGLGMVLGKRLRFSFWKSLLLAEVIVNTLNTFFSGRDITHKALRLTAIAFGTALGALVGGHFGAAMGAFVATAIFDELEKRGFVTKWIRFWENIGASMRDALFKTFTIGFFKRLTIEVRAGVADMLEDVNRLLSHLPGHPSIPIPPAFKSAQLLRDTIARVSTEALKDMEFQYGGVVPGPRGAPRLALVHGGETILPTHRGPMVIQLIMDRKVIGEAAIDYFHRTAKLKAGMIPGTLGS